MPTPRSSPLCAHAPQSWGLTLIELLVALGILALLVALVLPAVQYARESARCAACLHHLHQIGVALTNYQNTHGFYPAVNAGSEQIDGQQVSGSRFSPLVRMLPQLELAELFNTVNFSFRYPDRADALAANFTTMSAQIRLFLCPSDTVAVRGFGRVNYRFNHGPTPWMAPGRPGSWDGAFTVHQFYQPRDFPDGLSNTIGASERVQGDWITGAFSAGDYLLTDTGEVGRGTDYDFVDEAVAICAAAPPTLPEESRSGESWFFSGFHFSSYNHCTTPNSSFPDCSFLPLKEPLHERALKSGVFTARSRHPGGVNCLFMDASARFLGDSVHLASWRALGTRQRGD